MQASESQGSTHHAYKYHNVNLYVLQFPFLGVVLRNGRSVFKMLQNDIT